MVSSTCSEMLSSLKQRRWVKQWNHNIIKVRPCFSGRAWLQSWIHASAASMCSEMKKIILLISTRKEKPIWTDWAVRQTGDVKLFYVSLGLFPPNLLFGVQSHRCVCHQDQDFCWVTFLLCIDCEDSPSLVLYCASSMGKKPLFMFISILTFAWVWKGERNKTCLLFLLSTLFRFCLFLLEHLRQRLVFWLCINALVHSWCV